MRVQNGQGDVAYTPDKLAAAGVAALEVPADAVCLDPSVGGGAFARALPGRVVDVIDTDPNARGLHGHTQGHAWCGSFLSLPRPTEYTHDVVIGNPPFSLAEDFVRHAVHFAPRVIFLLGCMFQGGAKRRALWLDGPGNGANLAWEAVILERPSFRADGATDVTIYGFLEWRHGWTGPARKMWISAGQGGWGRPVHLPA